jgi:DNA-directed RNA polymerase specialized sigma24 family protein
MSQPETWHGIITVELQRLPLSQAAALGYVYACGLTQVETAKTMGKTPAEVATLVAAGLAAIGQRICAPRIGVAG